METETGKKVKTLRSDNGGEFFPASFTSWLAKSEIRHESSVPHTPQQNGVSERENRTLMEAARSQMYARKVPRLAFGASQLLVLTTVSIDHSPALARKLRTKIGTGKSRTYLICGRLAVASSFTFPIPRDESSTQKQFSA